MMRILIGLDGTDNPEGQGTGYMARQLGKLLLSTEMAIVESITRHQLLISPDIHYTSHNSSICLTLSAESKHLDKLGDVCRTFLTRESAIGSDSGLCIAEWDAVGSAIQNFGRRATQQVMSQEDTIYPTDAFGIILERIAGNGNGIIGALAGVGLRAGGRHGRFIWLPGLKKLNGEYTPCELKQSAQIDEVRQLSGLLVPSTAKIRLNSSMRPILHDGRAVLFVEGVKINEKTEWRIPSEETIKQLSD